MFSKPTHHRGGNASRHGLLWISLAALAALSTSACNIKPRDVWVYIDNAGNRPLEVTVDDKPPVTVAPGEVAKLAYPPGEYRFNIKRGDEVLCDLPRKLEKSDRFGATRKYLFNPDKLNRYQSYEAQYGTSRFQGVMQAGLMSYQKDPQLKREFTYKQLLKEVKLVPSDAWNDVSTIDYVLTPPPDKVYSRGTTRRTVLSRVEERLYYKYERMAKVEHPTDEDIDSLDELLDEMFADAL